MTKRTPEGVALNIRGLHRNPNLRTSRIPVTLEELHRQLRDGGRSISAIEAILAVEHDAGCSAEEARAAVEAVLPELFADYWIALEDCSPGAPQFDRPLRPARAESERRAA